MSHSILRLLNESADEDARGNSNKALELSLYAFEAAHALDDREIRNQAYLQHARMLLRVGRYSECIEISESLVNEVPDSEQGAHALVFMGRCAAETDDIQTARGYLLRAVEICRRMKFQRELANSLIFLVSAVYMPSGQFGLALTTLDEASEIHLAHGGDHWGYPAIKAEICEIIGERACIRDALETVRLNFKQDTRGECTYYMLLGRLFRIEQAFQEAEEYLNKALKIANMVNVPGLNITIRLDLSHLYTMQGKNAIGFQWAQDAYILAKRNGSRYYRGLGLIEMARSAWTMNDPTYPENTLLEAIRLLSNFGDIFDQTRAMLYLAAWYHHQNHPLADRAWIDTSNSILANDYAFLLETERELVFQILAGCLRSKDLALKGPALKMVEQLQRVPSRPLTITSLGNFAVQCGNIDVPEAAWFRRRAGDLFRYLLLQRNHSATRDQIIDAIWSNTPPDTVFNLLHQATSALRRILEPDLPGKFPSRYVLIEKERISLILPPGSWVDFEEFAAGLPKAINQKNLSAIDKMLALYQGELFPSLSYSDWAAPQRQKLQDLFQRGQLELAKIHYENQNWVDALHSARSVIELDGWNEDAVLLVMHAYLAMNDAPHALAAYLELDRKLKADLEISARQDLQELAEDIRKSS